MPTLLHSTRLDGKSMAKSNEKNIKNRSVSFNLDDPDQKRMFEYANERTNFSAYVKRLIQRDMEGGVGTPVVLEESKVEPKEELIEIDENIAEGYI